MYQLDNTLYHEDTQMLLECAKLEGWRPSKIETLRTACIALEDTRRALAVKNVEAARWHYDTAKLCLRTLEWF